jgi:hypothetical protein
MTNSTVSTQFVPDTLAESLVRALSEMPLITRDRTADIPGKDGKTGYSYKYTDLATLIDKVKPILARWGLALIQDVGGDGKTVSITTTLIHVSGQERHSPALLMGAGSTPQATGSAITYARRYQAMAALGLAPDDDDGQAAAAAPYREEDLSPPLFPPSWVDGYLRLARQKGLTDADIERIVLAVSGTRAREVRYLYQTEQEALNAATREALAARDATAAGSAPRTPAEPSEPSPATETPRTAPVGAPPDLAVPMPAAFSEETHEGTIEAERDESWRWACACGVALGRFPTAEAAMADHEDHVRRMWMASKEYEIEARVAKAKAKLADRSSSDTPDGDAADPEQARR